MPFTEISGIDLKVHAPYRSPMYEKLMGDVSVYTPGHKNGNINVFKITELYNGKHFKKTAKDTMDALRDMTSTEGNYGKLMMLFTINKEQKKNAYKNWYQKKLRSPFSKKDFINSPFSKLNRDLHDAHIAQYKLLRKYIGSLIENDNNTP
jgi:hypothetical protein